MNEAVRQGAHDSRRSRLVLRLTLVAISVTSVVYLLVVLIIRGAEVPRTTAFIQWFALSLATSLLIVRLPIGGATTSLGEIVDLASFAVVGPIPVLAANVIGVYGRNLIDRRASALRNLFNLGQWTIAALTAYFTLVWLLPAEGLRISARSLAAFVGAWLVYSLITTGLVSLVISLDRGSSFSNVWLNNYGNESLVSLAAAPLALLMAVLCVDYGFLPVVLLAVPLFATNAMLGALIERTRLRARSQRERQLAAMGKATASVVHELNRPVSRILMLADRALGDGGESAATFKKIVEEARSASRIADKILTSANLNIARENVLLVSLTREVQRLVGLDGIPVQVTLQGQLSGLTVEWDADLVLAGVLNLIRNAWDSQGGTGADIQVAAGQVETGGHFVDEEIPEALFVTTTDEGPGLPEGAEEDIFEALYSTKKSGMGIGLFLVNQVALAHGGKLVARNREEGGAEFTLVLPIRGR